jgi:hypothetical protein
VNSRIRIDNPYITIAGQTAPGDGITLRVSPTITSGPLQIRTHDVVIRYLSIRPGINPGQNTGGESDYNIDAITVGERDSSSKSYDPYNVIIDHVSMAWTTDEVVNTAWRHHGISVQWSIAAEAIDCDGTSSEGSIDKCGGKGPLIGGVNGKDVSFHHNLMTSNKGRNPMIKNAGGVVDVVNNIIFPSTDIGLIADSQYATQQINFVGNYIKAPPGVNTKFLGVRLAPPHNAGRLGSYKLYVKGNIGPMRPSDTDPEEWIVNDSSPGDPSFNARTYVHSKEGPIMQGNRINAPQVITTSALQAWEDVLSEAGASRKINNQGQLVFARDPIDTRIINDVRNGVSNTIAIEPWPAVWPSLAAGTAYVDSDHDGMADVWEESNFGVLTRGSPTISTGDFDNDGYTDLEEFLNGTDPATSGGTNPNPTVVHPTVVHPTVAHPTQSQQITPTIYCLGSCPSPSIPSVPVSPIDSPTFPVQPSHVQPSPVQPSVTPAFRDGDEDTSRPRSRSEEGRGRRSSIEAESNFFLKIIELLREFIEKLSQMFRV